MRRIRKLFSRVRALRIVRNTLGAITARNIAGLAVAFLVLAITAPIGIAEIYSANTTGWNTAVITIFTILLPIMFLVVVILRMLPSGKGG